MPEQAIMEVLSECLRFSQGQFGSDHKEALNYREGRS